MKPALFALYAAAMAAVGTVGPAFAQDSQAPGSEAEVTAATEIICRRTPPPTGSRIGARNICKTRAQWAQIEREGEQALENAGNRNRALNEGAGGDFVGANCGTLGRGC